MKDNIIGCNLIVFEIGYVILPLVYGISDLKQKEKFRRKAKWIKIWAVINLPIPAFTFFLLLFYITIGIFFEFNGIIIVSSLILLIFFFKFLHEFKRIREYVLMHDLITIYTLILAVFGFTFASSIIRDYSNEFYILIASFIFSIVVASFPIFLFYVMFRKYVTHKREKRKKNEEEKRDWKERINN